MKLLTMKQDLKEALDSLTEVKQVTGEMVESARLLMDDEDIRELRETALGIASATATIEHNLYQFGRITPKSKRFAVTK